jgi:hypothetical protein
MTNDELNQIVEQRCGLIKSILIEKATQYARGDRLSNFKKIAAFRSKEPEEALMGLVVKHIVALDDFIQDLPERNMPIEQWQEKIGDIINYMILLEAMVSERKFKEKDGTANK